MDTLIFLFWCSIILILYTYIGYPSLIILLAWIWPKRDGFVETYPSVTILIPAYNEEKYITKKIENTLLLDYPREKLQILIAADGSSDKTREIVTSYANKGVELSFVPDRNGKMAAIVRAMQFSRGEIVVFSDANNMYDSRAVRELLLPFSDDKVGATTGAKLIIEDGRDLSAAEGLYWKYESKIKNSESKIDSCVSSVGEILSIRKSAFVAPREKIINDDHYIILDLLRRGYRLVYTPRARSYEYVSQTARDEFTRRRRMNAGLFQTIRMSSVLLPFNRPLLLWEIISHKYLRAFVPFFMLFALVSNMFLIIMQHSDDSFFQSRLVYLVFFVAQLIFYLMAVIGNLLTIKGVLGKIFYLPTFLLNSNLATLAGLYSFLTDNQPHIWKQAQR